jgi:hypothetical protein
MEEANTELVNPQIANIRQEWDWVKPGLEEILHLDPNLTWRPEDVYASVISGESHLWVHPNFFTVTTVETDMFNGDKTFMIWIMKAKERGGANSVTYTKFYEDVAKQLGCQHIAGKSIQMPAIDYAGERVGWEITEITFGKDLRG